MMDGDMRVAIQGELGSFHHIVTRRQFGAGVDVLCCPTFAAVFEVLAQGRADAAIVATANSIAGPITEVQQLLQEYPFKVITQLDEPIHHCLITLSGVALDSISRVYSQGIALPQCSDFLDTHLPHAERVEYYDTAASVRLIKQEANLHYAAIASHLAAELEGMPILQANIENSADNVTTFAVLQER